tara:strand:- start:988 stop:1707 length:720 start_codon:yes stop_codon:yes gene_type:complete
MLPELNKPAPRKVSMGLITKKFLWNTFTIVGITFALFGGLFFTVFFVTSHYNAIDFKPTSAKQTQGIVIDTRKTNASIDNQTVVEVIYEFNYQKTIYRSRSYGTHGTNKLKAGSQVPVIFIKHNPKVSRVEGMKSGKLSPVVYFIASIFPIIGLFFVILGIFRTYGFYRILRHGKLTKAQIEHQSNRRALFKTSDGSSHKVTLLNNDYANKEFVEVIFLPNKPKKALTVPDLKSMLKSF